MKKHVVPTTVWTNPIHFLAFGFGSGVVPVAPGTFGTVAAIPLYWLMQGLTLPVYIAITGLVTLVGIWLCDVACRDTGVHDNPGVVWDEIAGYLITMIAAPQGWLWTVWGFLLFRLFDIWKPWPIRWFDRRVDGGFGVMLDDVLAAVYAWLVLQGSYLIWVNYFQV